MNNIIELIIAMEASGGLKSSHNAISNDQFNFEAANEIVKSLGGNLIVRPANPPSQQDENQNAHNMSLYIMALVVKTLKGF